MNHKKKIFIVIHSLGIGGAEKLALDDTVQFLKEGYDIKLITFRPEKEDATLKAIYTLPNHIFKIIPFTRLANLSSWFTMIRFFKKEKPDLIISHLWYANTIVRISAMFSGIKNVLSFEHNVYDGVKTWKQFLVDRVLQLFSKRIIAVSSAVKDSLIKHGINEKRIRVIVNAINIGLYKGAKPINRSILGISEDTFLYIYVGRLVSQKGVDVLLQAFSQTKEGVLLIVGGGILEEELISLSHELDIHQRVIFLGERSDVPQLLKTSDCFVLPSRYEGLGIVMLEAMAAGLPVIVSDFPARKEVVKDGENALVFEREKSDSLGALLCRIKDDPDLRESLIANAQKSIESFSIEKHISYILDEI